MKFLLIGALVALLAFPQATPPAQPQAPHPQTPAPQAPANPPAPETVQIPKTFHIAGIPGLGRNTRVSLTADTREFIFQKGKREVLRIPYERVSRAQLLLGERHYPEATYALAIATPFALGALMILKKRQMDTLAMDFRNERGGLMGVVVQLPKGQGAICRDHVARHGLTLQEPAVPAGTDKKPSP